MVISHRAPGRRRVSALAGLALFLVPVTIIAANRSDLGAARHDTAATASEALDGVTSGIVSKHVPSGLAPSDWAGIRRAYERHRHQVVPIKGRPNEWQTRNPGQQWLTRFDGRGVSVMPEGAAWEWGLELRSYGLVDTLHEIQGSTVNVLGERLTYRRDAALDEWFVNDGRGLEHGFTLHKRPAGGDGPVMFRFHIRGGLRARVQRDRLGVTFVAADGTAAVSYTGLTVSDADQRRLAAHFESIGEDGLGLVVDSRGARYPLTIDPVAQQAYLKASNSQGGTGVPGPTGSGDLFGRSVAISGNTVVVGAAGEDSNATGINGDQTNNSATQSGAAYVFVRSGGVWSQQAYLKASNTEGFDNFGWSVAISGDTVVVGARGESSNATGINGNQTDDSMLNAGAAYVFVRDGGLWTQQAYLKASNTEISDEFGWSVAISGDTVVVGADSEDSNATGVNGDQTNNGAINSGAAYVFARTGGTWSQQAYLKGSITPSSFGWSAAISGDTVVVGGPGGAFVFSRTGAVWSQQASLTASNFEPVDDFGVSVAVSGDTVVVGAMSEDSNATGIDGDQTNNSAADSGAAYVFTRVGGVWSQQAYLKASNTEGGDFFGVSVAISGDTLVVGAEREDSSASGIDGNQTDNSAANSGAAYVFTRNASVWTQQAYLKASNTGSGDNFGHSVAISGDAALVGAYQEDSNATGIDGDQVNNSAVNSGAAYVFTLGAPDFDSPVIDCADADGVWYASNVTLACTATDAGSGLADPETDASFTLETGLALDTESANASTNSHEVCDIEGNCATAGPISDNKIDRKAPMITITSPALDGTYQLNASVGASYACDDGGAGVALCQGPVSSGGLIDTSSTGTKTFEVSANDSVGNPSSLAVTYSVVSGGGGGQTAADVGITLAASTLR